MAYRGGRGTARPARTLRTQGRDRPAPRRRTGVVRVRRGEKRRPYRFGAQAAGGRASGLLPVRKGRGAELLLLVAVIVAAIAIAVLLRSCGRRPVQPPSNPPESTATPAATVSLSPTIQPTAVPTREPAELVIDARTLSWPQPSLHIGSREALIDLYWWMIYTGTDSVSLQSLTLSKSDLTDISDKFSNYFDAVAYGTSPAYLRAELKPGLAALLALQKGTVDQLEGETREVAVRARDAVAGLLKVGMTDVEKELAIHDYILDHCEYLTSVKGENVDDARGFFLNGLCQCAGYVDTFRLMARLAGLEVEMVGGPTTQDSKNAKGHAWNLIRLNGLWYVVDLTWDDRVGSGGAIEHTFFNLPASSFGSSRSWDQAMCPDGDYAASVDGNYYYSASKYTAKDAAEGLTNAVRQLDSEGKATVFFTGTDAARQVSAALVEHYGRSGTCVRLSEDLTLPLYRFTLR